MYPLSLWNPSPRHPGNGRMPLVETPPRVAFHREVDQLLDDLVNGFGFRRAHRALPAVQVHEAEREYTVSIDLPGVELKDIDLSFSEGMLTVKAERKAGDGEALYSDRWTGSFERVVGIGTDIDESQIRARLKDGVLAVTLPKLPDRLPRRIQIE